MLFRVVHYWLSALIRVLHQTPLAPVEPWDTFPYCSKMCLDTLRFAVMGAT